MGIHQRGDERPAPAPKVDLALVEVVRISRVRLGAVIGASTLPQASDRATAPRFTFTSAPKSAMWQTLRRERL
jgi:hypothetical protein